MKIQTSEGKQGRPRCGNTYVHSRRILPVFLLVLVLPLVQCQSRSQTDRTL